MVESDLRAGTGFKLHQGRKRGRGTDQVGKLLVLFGAGLCKQVDCVSPYTYLSV